MEDFKGLTVGWNEEHAHEFVILGLGYQEGVDVRAWNAT